MKNEEKSIIKGKMFVKYYSLLTNNLTELQNKFFKLIFNSLYLTYLTNFIRIK